MADRIPLANLSDSELEQRLVDLGPLLYPSTPDLASRVRQRLESAALTPLPPSPVGDRRGGTRQLPSPRSEGPGTHEVGGAGDEGYARREGRWRSGASWQLWLVAALVLIAIAGGLVLFPEARNAIADRLGLPGVMIQWVDEVPSPEPTRAGAPLLLGRAVTLTEAQAAVDFPVRIPTAAGFNAPREVYLLDQDEGAMVSFVYPAAPGLPASDETGVGALLTQFRGDADRGLIEKGLPADGAQEIELQAVSVAGEPGFWISGAPHGFFFVCYDVGECRQERYRLAGNVLLWELDGVTLRLESALTLEAALAIAESVPALE